MGNEYIKPSGMQYSHTAKYGGVKYYLREGDELVIGRANLNKIEYRFWNGKLYSVEIFTKGFTDFERLKEAVFEKFGASFEVTLNTTEGYTWNGKAGIASHNICRKFMRWKWRKFDNDI